MARSWARLHEHGGNRPGPLTYDVVATAVANKLAESDDLDWKRALPSFAPVKGIWNEFAKDIAAMANTRGGGTPVDTDVLRIVARETVVLADTFRRRLTPDSPLDTTATVAKMHSDRRLVPYSGGYGNFAPTSNARHPKRLLPASTELAPNADDQTLRECAQEPAGGLLHQFGVNR
jgi:hypothetical protein